MKHILFSILFFGSIFSTNAQYGSNIKLDPDQDASEDHFLMNRKIGSLADRGIFRTAEEAANILAPFLPGLDTAYVNLAGDSLTLVLSSGDTVFFAGGGGGGVTDGDKGDITITGGVWNIDPTTITATELASNAVTNAKILNDAVDASKISPDAVGSSEIAANAVSNSELASNIDVIQLADGSVTNTEFQYVQNVTSDIQTQLNSKLSSETQGIDNVLSQNEALTANRTIDQANREIYFDGHIDEGDFVQFRSKEADGLGGSKIAMRSFYGESRIVGFSDASSQTFDMRSGTGTGAGMTIAGDFVNGNFFELDNITGLAYFNNTANNYRFGINVAPVAPLAFAVKGDVNFTGISGNNFFDFVDADELAYLYSVGQDFKFGINQTAPSEALDVVGNGQFSGTLSASNLSGTNTGDQNLSGYAPLASPTFTGTVTIPTPFTLGATSVTSTGTQLNYLNAATGTTGTTSTNLVFSTSPTLVTPILGTPTSGNLANCTFPTLNQNTTGSAATLTTPRTIAGTSFNGSANISITHANLSSLGADDHTQYGLLAGRSGGQTLKGGTGTTDDLILQSTSGVGATGAEIQFKVGNNGGTRGMTILNNGYVGIGNEATSPSYPLSIVTDGPAPAYTMVQLKPSSGAVNLGSSIGLETRYLSTTVNWFFGAGSGSGTNNFRIVRVGTPNIDYFNIMPVTGNTGIHTEAPDGKLEVNLETSGKFRLSYNDADGSASTYVDQTLSSTGVVTNNAVGSSSSFVFSDPFANTAGSTTLGAAATTFAVNSNVMTITGNGGGNTVATITAGFSGQILTLIFADANVTITDDASGTASTINLSAAFTSTANDVMTLVHNGTSWREVSRSIN